MLTRRYFIDYQNLILKQIQKMKNIYLVLLVLGISLSIKAQTTLQYSGTNNYDYYGNTAKIGGIAQNTIVTSSPATSHVGLLGVSSNATSNNYGIIGTTKPTTLGNPGNPFLYVGVMGDNASNDLNFNLGNTFGGIFKAKNAGANSYIVGVNAQSTGSNNSSVTYGIDALSINQQNTTVNKTIAIRAFTNSGTSSPTNVYKDVTNPGGYFSSNDGQGIFATTTDGYNYSGGKYSQAITGYSNVANASNNVGVVGYAEGTGVYKVGVFGQIGGAPASFLSSAVAGLDNINAINTYAGYFEGKVYMNGKVGVGVNTISTNEQMEIDGRVRIRRNGFAAGIWFNNTANTTATTDGAFVGLSNETAGSETVGFWLNGGFRFFVDRSGNTTINGGLSVGGGQKINKIIKTNIAATINPIGANSFLTQTYTLSGVAVGDNIVVNIDGIGNYIIASTRVSATDTVEIKYYNPGGANGFPTTGLTMYVTAFK
jgi:hypothetical protein